MEGESQAVAVRDFTVEDQDQVRALILGGLKEHWGGIDPLLNEDLNDIAQSYGHGRTVVATLDEGWQIVGTGTVVPEDDVAARIVRMSVSPGLRRSGIGRSIVHELVVTAVEWGKERVILETSSGWTDAIAFYLSCGFRITHTDRTQFGPSTCFELRCGRVDGTRS